MGDHAHDDGEEGAGESAQEKLFTTLETGVFTCVETQECDRH